MIDKPRHEHYCKACGILCEINLDHVAAWTPEFGCDASCTGTFSHPNASPCGPGDIGHDRVYLKVRR